MEGKKSVSKVFCNPVKRTLSVLGVEVVVDNVVTTLVLVAVPLILPLTPPL